MRLKKRRTLGEAVVVAMALAVPAGAVPVNHLFEEWGVGSRDLAMGNTGVATSSDFGAVYLNPAALARVPGTTVVLGSHLHDGDLSMTFEDRAKTVYVSPDRTNTAIIGITTDLAVLGIEDDDWLGALTIGMATSIAYPVKSFTTFADPNEPQFFRDTDRQNSILPFGLGLSIEITEWLSIGASAMLTPTDTKIAVDTISATEILPEDSEGEFLDIQFIPGVEADAFPALAPVVGLMLSPPIEGLQEMFHVGVVYRGEISTIDGQGPVSFRVILSSGDLGIELPDAFLTDIAFLTGFSPRQVSFGLGFTPTPAWTITVDTIWKQWSKWRTSFDRFPEDRFEDTWQVRAGAEHVLTLDSTMLPWVAFRAGYYFEPSPAPDQSGPSNFLDPDRHVLSAGVGWAFTDPWELSPGALSFGVGFQAHLLDDIRTANEDDPVYGPISGEGWLYGGSVTLEMLF